MGDTYQAVLKEDILCAHPRVIDDAGRGLIRTGASTAVPTSAQADTAPVPPTMAVLPPLRCNGVSSRCCSMTWWALHMAGWAGRTSARSQHTKGQGYEELSKEEWVYDAAGEASDCPGW